MIKKQITAYLANKPGALSKVVRAMAAAKVNIEGVSVVESTDTGIVRMVVNKAAASRKALAKVGIACTEQSVMVVPLADKPGSLAAVTARLAKAGVNINYIYGTTCKCGCDCECKLVISASNLKKVKSLLG